MYLYEQALRLVNEDIKETNHYCFKKPIQKITKVIFIMNLMMWKKYFKILRSGLQL